jgi:hypothetical protein
MINHEENESIYSCNHDNAFQENGVTYCLDCGDADFEEVEQD